MRWSMVVTLAVACQQPAPRVPAPVPTVDPAAGLLTAIDTGDYSKALRVWCDGYAAAGLPCSSVITVEHLQPTDVLSRLSDSHVVRMQPMPAKEQGIAYWQNWSKVLGGDVHSRFRGDDDEARRIAGAMLLTVFAHELGHHVAMRHGCAETGGAGELLADELSTPLVQQLAHGTFGVIHARMRMTADAMIAAVPEAVRVEVPRDVDVRAWARGHELPMDAGPYASLHLSRQRRLLEDKPSLSDAVERACGARARARLAKRIVEPGTVRTRGRWELRVAEHVAIDRSGAIWGVLQDHDQMDSIEVRRIDRPSPVRTIKLPAEPNLRLITTVAATSGTHFVLGNGVDAWEVRAAADGTLVAAALAIGEHRSLAFDEHETVWWSNDGNAWTARSAKRSVELAVDPRIAGTFERDASEWRDGPLDQARGRPWRFTVANERVVFADSGRAAIRAIGSRVTTIAGSIEGRRDGTTAEAELLEVLAITALADGSYAVAERDRSTLIVRIITPTRT